MDAPRTIGEFRILRVLGRGGMGAVYEAEQRDPPRRVALKVVHGGALVDDETLALFRREVRALARLTHPGIASLYASGTTPEGVPHFAMELVDGKPLDAWRRERDGAQGLPSAEIERRIAVFLGICDAVAYAHTRGVLHRDLKPSNVVVREREGEPEVKVLDFGLARITEGEAAASRVTERGTLRGTVPYMSPEQLSGDPEAVDARSDVYALGVLLYELLTGAHPHAEGDLGSLELPGRILKEPARPISRSWKGLRPLDPDLATIVMKCLEKEPARRYATAQALAEDLRRMRSGHPIAARPPSTAYQLRKMIARNRTGAAIVGAAALALLAATIAMAVLARHLAVERDRANREAEAARASASALSSVLFNRTPGQGIARVDDPETIASVVDEISRTWSGDPEGEVRLLRTAGTALFENGSFDLGIALLERGVEIDRARHPDWGRRGGAHTLGEMYQRAGRLEDAEAIFREVLESVRAVPEPAAARALGYSTENLGCVLRDLGRLDEAEGLLLEAKRLYESETLPDPRLLASVHDSLGNLFLARGDLHQAETEHRRALAIREVESVAGTPLYLQSLHHVGIVLLRQGRLDEAEPLLREALERRESVLGPSHPDTGATLAALGELETARGRRAEARAFFERASGVYAKGLAETHPRVAELRRGIARLDGLSPRD